MSLLILFAIAPLIVQLIILSVLSGVVNRSAYRLFGKTLYLMLMCPGVIVHEFSHLLGCLATGTKVHRVRLFSPREEGGNLILGEVEHERPKSPVARTVVAGAPFFGGATAILLLTRIFFPSAIRTGVAPVVVLQPEVRTLLSALLTAFESYLHTVRTVFVALDWSSWRSYILLYILFSLAAHIAPSRTDLTHAAGGATILAALLFVTEVVTARISPLYAATLASSIAKGVGILTVLLGYGLATLCVAAVLIAILSFSFSIFRGKRR